MSKSLDAVTIPKWGIEMTQGTIVAWHKDEGITLVIASRVGCAQEPTKSPCSLDSDWLHRMMLDRGCSCPCKTPHSRAVVAVEQPAAPGGDWYPANPSHNDDHPTCCICMTSVDPAGARRLPCSHAFHPECLARCLQHSALCPLCKVPVE